MRSGVHRTLAGAALIVTAIATSLVAAGPASADPARPNSCRENHICLYEHNNFNDFDKRTGRLSYLEADYFFNCGIWPVRDGWVSSVYNNTDAHLQLWDASANPDYLVGTAVRRKGYTYLGARGNDTTDMVIGVGCK
jgi:hypothetical protein